MPAAWPDDHKAMQRPQGPSSVGGSDVGRRESGWERGKGDVESNPGRERRDEGSNWEAVPDGK